MTAGIAGAVAVASAILLPLAPVKMSMPSVDWPQDVRAPESTSLQLASQTPRGLEVRFSCRTAEAVDRTSDGVLLATINPAQPASAEHGLLIRVQDGRVQVDAAGQRLLDEELVAASCSYLVQASDGGLVVSRDGTDLGRGGELPEIDALATSLTVLPGADAEDLSVQVLVDDQMASSPTPLKTGALVLMLLAVLAAAGALVRLDRARRSPSSDEPAALQSRMPGSPDEGRPSRHPRQRSLLIVDALVLLALLVWVFLAPMTDDDGYYSAMARNAPSEGYVGNYYQLLNQNFTPFTWFYNVLSLWQGVGNSTVLLRIPALICGAITWLLLRRFVLNTASMPSLVSSTKARLGALLVIAVVFLAWWLPYDMGVRPEAVVGMLTLGTLLGVMSGVETGRLAPIALAVAAAGFGVTCHPTGVICLAPLIVGSPKIWRLLRADGSLGGTLGRLAALLAPGALASAATFGDGTLHDFLRGQEIFLSIQAQNTIFDEWQRYSFLLSQIAMGSYAKRAAVLIAIIALVWFAVLLVAARLHRVEVSPRLVYAGFSLGLAFFLFWLTPSKWTHHFGAMAGLGAAFVGLFLVSAPLLVRSLRDSGQRIPGAATLFAAVSTIAVIALAMHGPNDWPYSWLLGMPDPGKSPDVAFVEFDSMLWWALGLVLLIGIFRRSVSRRQLDGWRGLTPVLAVPALVVVFLLTSLTYLGGSFALATLRTLDTYSPYAAAVQDPLARNCDAAGGIEVLDESTAEPLTQSQVASQPVEPQVGFVFGGGFFAGMPPAATAAQGMPTDLWGSLTEPAGEDGVGSLTSPWFELPGSLSDDQRLVVTASGRLDKGNELRAEYASSDGIRIRSDHVVTDDVDAPFWRSFELDAGDSSAALVRLVARDVSGGTGGWLAFTGPSVQQMTTLQSYLPEDAAVGVAWPLAFIFPCERQPRISSGIAEPLAYAIVWGLGVDGLFENTWVLQRGGLYAPALREASVTKVIAEIRGAPQVQSFSVYRLDHPYASAAYDLNRSSGTVMGWQDPPLV
ncbi:MAG: arabinosyltransferase domain-containing protein [Geodermatophilaceae bacterium]|nr:arabinosyltransferase domain-containing protein [Geodermatophilaceae bacterium]